MHILQHIILPERLDETYNMYVRENEGCVKKESGSVFEKSISFDTYFNCFSLKKWQTYTSLSSLKLVLEASGNFFVEVCELHRDNTETVIASEYINSATPVEIVIEIPESHAQMIFFRLHGTEDTSIKRAFYATEDAPVQDVHLNAVICTFKKESYVYKNTGKFKKLFEDYPEAKEHFFVNIVDNGQSLDLDKIDCPNVQVYPNINAGGAGGFARGMIEVLKSDRPATHVLLMDDDIEIIPQSILLTIAFLGYVKEEYRRYFIGGAMLNIMYKNVKSASLEWFKTSKTSIGSIGEQNLNFRNEIIISDFNSKDDNQYQAWWYCVVPMTVLHKNNLPFPLFFRHDDIDFSFRNKAKIILINGVCVWHEPFYKKKSIFPDYIQLRNMLALSASDAHLNEKSIFCLIWRRFLTEVRTLNYKGAHAYPDAIEHVCQGPEFFMNPDNCAYALKNGLSRNEKLVPISQIEGCTEYMDYYALGHGGLRGIKKLIYKYTINGHFLPGCVLRSKKGMGWHADYAADKFYLRKYMVVVDPVNGMAAERFRSQADFWNVFKRMLSASWKYCRTRKELRKAYAEKYPYMTSLAFWEKYLGISEK